MPRKVSEIIESSDLISADEVKTILTEVGLTQSDVARQLNLDPSTISKLCNLQNPIDKVFSIAFKAMIKDIYKNRTNKLEWAFEFDDRNLNYWSRKEYAQEDFEQKAKTSNVIFLPWENFRENIGPIFPVGTNDFFKFLQENNVSVEACIQDDLYMEIALHSDEKRFPHVLVSLLFAPIFVNLLTNYISERWKVEPNPPISIKMSIHDENGKLNTLSYNGNAKDFTMTVIPAIEKFKKSQKEKKNDK